MLAEILTVLPALGGLAAIGLVIRAILAAYRARSDKRKTDTETRVASESAIVDAATRLMAASPAEIDRLAGRLRAMDEWAAQAEDRIRSLNSQLTQAIREKDDLAFEVQALRNRLAVVDDQLTQAQLELSALRKEGPR